MVMPAGIAPPTELEGKKGNQPIGLKAKKGRRGKKNFKKLTDNMEAISEDDDEHMSSQRPESRPGSKGSTNSSKKDSNRTGTESKKRLGNGDVLAKTKSVNSSKSQVRSSGESLPSRSASGSDQALNTLQLAENAKGSQ